ncbi:MAG: hypothetical protein EBS85_03750 [Micrococcales bacterium]|nr:hypothetical protein [Micrococcales bacterium]
MSHFLSKAHQQQIAEKTAIIANQAFVLGRQSEADRIKGYIKEQQCELTVDTGICEHDNCYLLGDIIAYINQYGKHEKNEIKL